MTQPLRKPNLFVIGAMKSGTTSLHEYLATHPQIGMSQQKEPAFFAKEFTHHRGEAWYLNLFPQDTRYRYLGESSTQYTRLPLFQGIPERLYEFNPQARLIYIMRKPFDRVVSHYWQAVRVRNFRKGRGEPRTLLKAVLQDPDTYLATGNYAAQLAPYIALFGRHALHTLTFEALIEDPQRELNKIYSWLDLAPHPLGDQLAHAHNQTPRNSTSAAGAGILYRIRFSKTWDRVSPYMPNALKTWAKARTYRQTDERQIAEELQRLKAAIGDQQRDHIAALSQLLMREFPEWQDTL